MPTDERGRHVARFQSELRNAGRLGVLADLIVGMYTSGEWREYMTASGAEHWLECEFDYFLMACDASHTDVQRILSWDSAKAVDVAGGMFSDDRDKRRSLDDAAAAWPSPTGASLIDIAQRNGWLNSRGRLRPAPVPERARTKVQHGVTADELARRRREEQISADRRSQLVQRLDVLVADASELELRYVRDVINERLAAKREKTT